MLTLDLARLAREGSLRIEARLPPDDALWEASDLRFADDVQVSLKASFAGSGELVVRGEISAPLRAECRRCLEPVEVGLDEEVTLVFASSDDPTGGQDSDTRPLDARTAEVDLGAAVREEVILAMNPYVVCRPQCAGLCGRCGANLNEEQCECGESEPDPRWDALRAIKGR